MADRLTIQRFPKGLLGILGMQASGDVPASLTAEMRGQLDVLQLYLLDARTSVQANVGSITNPAGTIGQANAAEVPAGQLWFVHGLQMQCAVAIPAGLAIRVKFGVKRGSAFPTTYYSPATVEGAAGEMMMSAIEYPQPALWRPGDVPGFFCESFTGVGSIGPFFMGVHYTPIYT